MTEPNRRGDMDVIKKLADSLATCGAVRKHDTSGENPESWRIALALSELEALYRTFCEEHLPALRKPGLTEEQTHEILMDIGNDISEIVWWMNIPSFYRIYANAPTLGNDPDLSQA